MAKKKIELASREWKRTVFSAVGRNFLKTVTEPITNSDSALKKQAGVPHSAGLVEQMFALKAGHRVNTAELKAGIPKAARRQIKIELVTAGGRLCRVIDTGPGLTETELDEKFGTYASAKAKGEKTRSLFGRGALDVLLHHQDSVIYSVKGSMFSRCRIYWDKASGNPICDAESLGKASKKLLDAYDLPHTILNSGTIVQFHLKDGTRVPNEELIVAKISSFYMLRLIAGDPNTEVLIERTRADGKHIDALTFDFPIGTVVGRFDDVLDLGEMGKLPVAIMVARSDVPLETDPVNIERRENGLLFIDENDAVLDLTLLPDYNGSPYLKHIYGLVRITGIRDVLESKLEDEEAEAVLTPTRDGFDSRNEMTRKLFGLVEQHVKPIYDREEKNQKKGDVSRSEKLDQRIKEVLKAINQFNAEETEEEGSGHKERSARSELIYFSVDSTRLYAGITKHIGAYVNLEKVKEGEIVLFGSDRPEIKVEPDSEPVQGKKKHTHQRIDLAVTCDVKGLKGTITALTLNKDGNEIRAQLKILGVDDPPLLEVPEDIGFAAFRYSGDPNRPSNNAILLVNLDAFTGYPEITFWLEDVIGSVSLASGSERVEVKVAPAHRIEGRNVARVPISFRATGWGQRAVLWAKAKRTDGKLCQAKCKLVFEHRVGDQKFSNFHYEDLGRRSWATWLETNCTSMQVTACTVRYSAAGQCLQDIFRGRTRNPERDSRWGEKGSNHRGRHLE